MQSEEGADADKHNHPPGYQDFITSASTKNKKRVLPVAPQQRRIMAQSSLVDSFEESYTEKVTLPLVSPVIVVMTFVLCDCSGVSFNVLMSP